MGLTDNEKGFDLYGILNTTGECCSCGRRHTTDVKEIVIQKGVLAQVPELVRRFGGTRPFILADDNTYKAAGDTVCRYLDGNSLPYSIYVYGEEHLKPDEYAAGKAIMYFDGNCDFILGIGAGTINDIGKFLAHILNLPYMVIATAPSMDGYASASSSMVRDGIKVSLDSVCPTIIAADLDVIARAPVRLLQAGIGDMLAKYISICEWRLSHLITGEYYCDKIAEIIRGAVKKCRSVENLQSGDPETLRPVMEGLIVSGLAMNYAGISRPASGMEHYFSHLLDMRALEFDTPCDLHGIQCGVATLLCLRIYRYIAGIIPDRKKARAFTESFSIREWNKTLTEFLGKSAGVLVQLEKEEHKYDILSHRKRLDIIAGHWDEILRIISEELPSLEETEKYMQKLNMPTRPEELGHSGNDVRNTFLISKDIRNKYIGSRLLWDLGLLDEAAGYILRD
jgi:glycerol-1-phosphate dehydrogenase [NAD(P)+]